MKIKQMTLTCLAGAALLALSGCSTPGSSTQSDDPSYLRSVRQDIGRSMSRNDIEGMSVVVASREGTIWAEGFGSAGSGRALTEDTPMMLASVTKLFTAVAVMQLVEDGLVDLGSPIGAYVPQMAGVNYPGASEPTVRDLLTHHGGLPSDLLKGTIYSGPTEGYATAFMDLVPAIATEPLTEPPRHLSHYSNSGYTLLGALIANVSGVGYTDYIESEILARLGMSDSGFRDPAVDGAMSLGFSDGHEVQALRISGLPEGGLAASAADLGRFMTMLLNGAEDTGGGTLDPDTLDWMFTRQNGDVDLDYDFEKGLGFNLMPLPGYPEVRVAWHDGGTSPFASTLLVAPDHGVGVALLSNTDERLPTELSYEILAKAIEAETGLQLVRSREATFGRIAGRALEPEELSGVYSSEIGALVVGGTESRPTMLLAGMKLHLVGREAESYGLQARVAGFLPLPISSLAQIRLVFREIDGQRVVAYYEGGKFRSVALAVEPAPVPAAWHDRFGVWSVSNPDPDPFVETVALGYDESIGFMTITVKVASIPDPVVLPVVADGNDALVVAGLGRHLGERLRVDPATERIHWAGLTLSK